MWHKIAKCFATVDCVEEMNAGKSCMDGEYGSFEHLLCFFVFPSVADFVFGRTFTLPLHSHISFAGHQTAVIANSFFI